VQSIHPHVNEDRPFRYRFIDREASATTAASLV